MESSDFGYISISVPNAWKPEPYDTVMLWDGKQWWFGHFDCATDEWIYYFGTEQKSDKKFTHWTVLPAPPTKGE